MRILLTSTDNPYTSHLGGKHIHLRLLERGLTAAGAEVTALYYNRDAAKEFIKRSALMLFPEKRMFKTKIDLMTTYLRKRIPAKEFDVIHAHDILSLLAVSHMPQKKTLTLHGYFARENIEFVRKEKDRKAIYPLLLDYEKAAVKYADHIITVDQRLKDYVESQFTFPADQVTVMYNAVDTDRFSPVAHEEQERLKRSLGFSKEHFIVLVPRRLVEKNGVIHAVQAMKSIKSKNIRMIVAGDGPERKAIANRARQDGRIQLAGTIPHDRIDPYYKMTDIVLIPSITSHGIQEATSLSMLEGMACGKVAVCSSIGGMKEVIQHMKNGILVAEKEPAMIAQAIEEIDESPSLNAKIGAAAREYVMQNHSYISHAERVLRIYGTALGS